MQIQTKIIWFIELRILNYHILCSQHFGICLVQCDVSSTLAVVDPVDAVLFASANIKLRYSNLKGAHQLVLVDQFNYTLSERAFWDKEKPQRKVCIQSMRSIHTSNTKTALRRRIKREIYPSHQTGADTIQSHSECNHRFPRPSHANNHTHCANNQHRCSLE